MNLFRAPLDVLFRCIPPEELLDCLGCGGQWQRNRGISSSQLFSARHIPTDLFDRYSREAFPPLSINEVELIHDYTNQRMERQASPALGAKGQTTVFHLLPELTDGIPSSSSHKSSQRMLDVLKEEPICNSDAILRWRSISFRLGQDLLTTAHLAWKDRTEQPSRTYFAWPRIIHTNNETVRQVMQQGPAENHFHLEGSVPIFELSWVCLMNHPQESYRMEKSILMRHNLRPEQNYHSLERRLQWSERMLLAAWIRSYLFRCIQRGSVSRTPRRNFLDFFNHIPLRVPELVQTVNALRSDHGWCEQRFGKALPCLDYAYPRTLPDERNTGLRRLLVGERYFLYHCFHRCFQQDKEQQSQHQQFDPYQQNLFYLYLLLKSALRSELIQLNHRMGFQNFSEYQDRKSFIWNRYPEYSRESYRIAVNDTIQENHLSSLEARIMTKHRTKQVSSYIYDVDRTVLEAQNVPFAAATTPPPSSPNRLRNRYQIQQEMAFYQREPQPQPTLQGTDFFFVLHFPKRSLPPKHTPGQPRHNDLRFSNKAQAFALAGALQKDPYLCSRIRGIDACSNEIGCRPEVFATEFRFLSQYVLQRSALRERNDKNIQPLLSITYHAGEDFISVTDGLRAIDEAVLFLNMKHGSRIGHALALGIDPAQHYRLREDDITERKQDRLDDLVWLLFRTYELGITVSPHLRPELETEAKTLLEELYRKDSSEHLTLEDYYQSWKLRGHHPEVIFSMRDQSTWSPSRTIISPIDHQYECCKENRVFALKQHCPTKMQCELASRYLYHKNTYLNGRDVTPVKITGLYLDLLKEVQAAMTKHLISLGIYVECNPSSNLLISSFDRYDQHPLFRFFPPNLQAASSHDALNVSLNTDDQGVFDTSLEYEYALIAACMAKQQDKLRSPRYSPHEIRSYLSELCTLSKMQVFPRAD